VFFAAGLPVLLIPFIVKSMPESMPESMPFLRAKGRHDELKVIAAKLEPSYRPAASDRPGVPVEGKADSAPINHLRRDAARRCWLRRQRGKGPHVDERRGSAQKQLLLRRIDAQRCAHRLPRGSHRRTC
jgi:hypothetical protein